MDKKTLIQGFRKLIFTVLLMFMGPTFIFQAFKNEEHPWYVFVLIVGISICIMAIYQGFLGIKKVVEGILGKKE